MPFIYAVADDRGVLRYIGETANETFRKRGAADSQVELARQAGKSSRGVDRLRHVGDRRQGRPMIAAGLEGPEKAATMRAVPV
jgi:hypothetical protein